MSAIFRTPVLRVLADGNGVQGAKSAEVEQNNAYQADSFRAEFRASPTDIAWWAGQTELILDIQVSIDGGSGWKSLIIGQTEHLSIHPDTGLVQIEGHDLSMRLIEAKTQESFQNRTSSEIVTELAGRHGLTADVTATTTPAGRFYEIDHTHESLGQFGRTTTEWDLLTFLAQSEGFDLYVQGTTLHFHPAAQTDTGSPYIITYTPRTGAAPYPTSPVEDLRLERSLTLARDIEVIVQSWHAKQGKSFRKVARAIGAKSATAATAATQKGTPTQRFVFIRPNLTEAQAQAEANRLLAEISKHERNVTWQGAADLVLTPRDIVDLRGTGTDFDQRYYVNTVSRRISFDGGFCMSVTLKNQTSNREVALT